MTEKRFIGSSGGVYDQYKGDRFTWAEWEEIIQIMNNLNEKAIERSKALSKLQKENNKIKSLLLKKIKELNDSYQKSAKAGMPTGGIIGELDSFEEICEEMGWFN